MCGAARTLRVGQQSKVGLRHAKLNHRAHGRNRRVSLLEAIVSVSKMRAASVARPRVSSSRPSLMSASPARNPSPRRSNAATAARNTRSAPACRPAPTNRSPSASRALARESIAGLGPYAGRPSAAFATRVCVRCEASADQSASCEGGSRRTFARQCTHFTHIQSSSLQKRHGQMRRRAASVEHHD